MPEPPRRYTSEEPGPLRFESIPDRPRRNAFSQEPRPRHLERLPGSQESPTTEAWNPPGTPVFYEAEVGKQGNGNYREEVETVPPDAENTQGARRSNELYYIWLRNVRRRVHEINRSSSWLQQIVDMFIDANYPDLPSPDPSEPSDQQSDRPGDQGEQPSGHGSTFSDYQFDFSDHQPNPPDHQAKSSDLQGSSNPSTFLNPTTLLHVGVFSEPEDQPLFSVQQGGVETKGQGTGAPDETPELVGEILAGLSPKEPENTQPHESPSRRRRDKWHKTFKRFTARKPQQKSGSIGHPLGSEPYVSFPNIPNAYPNSDEETIVPRRGSRNEAIGGVKGDEAKPAGAGHVEQADGEEVLQIL